MDRSWREDIQAVWLGSFAAAIAGIVALAVSIHGLAFRFANLPLPLGRTGIYLVPLCTLLAGTIAAAASTPPRFMVSQWLRRGITAVLIYLACSFLLCLRLSYFREYDWDADTRDVYSALARLNQAYGVTDVGANGVYVTTLNYYRSLSKPEKLLEFKVSQPDPPPGKSVYVLWKSYERDLIEKEKLAVVFRGNFTDVVIAVEPGGPVPPSATGR